MKKTFILICIVSLVFCVLSMIPARIEAEAPEEYIIKKGDTLWDISDTKLEDYFLWPRLWNVNPHIKNPDLIYPGNTIRIPSREELMRMPLLPKKKLPTVSKPKKPVFELPELVKPKYIVDKNLYIKSGWIADEFPGIGEITYSPLNRKIAGEGEIVYLKIDVKKLLSYLGLSEMPALLVVNDEGIKSGKRFFTIRDIKVVKHPITGKTLGHQIRITGILEIIGIDDKTTKAKIIESFEDVEIGDSLLPYQETEPPLASDATRNPDIQGYIVESHTNSQLTSKGDIVFLDKGHDAGLEVGDVFYAFSEPPIKRSIGKIQVISLQPTTSNAIILDSTQEIILGTKWGQKNKN